jgi:hypothetical protein
MCYSASAIVKEWFGVSIAIIAMNLCFLFDKATIG